MATPKIVPLLVMVFPERSFYYSTVDVSLRGFQLGNLGNNPVYYDDPHLVTNFKPFLVDDPSIDISFDVFNPTFSYNTINIKFLNRDNVNNYSHMYGIESATILFVKYDLANNVELFRAYGKMSEVKSDRFVFEFTMKDECSSHFTNQPFTSLKEDTFQTILTIGPFDENPFKSFGILVDIAPALGQTIISTPFGLPLASRWPVTPTGTDYIRSIVAWIEHPALYNEDDEYWVGSMVSIVNDPMPIDMRVARSNRFPKTNVLIANSPYTNWPNGYNAASPANPNIKDAAYTEFALGATAYVIKCGNKYTSRHGGTYSNARWNEASKRGRLWFDINGPNDEVLYNDTPANMAAAWRRRMSAISNGVLHGAGSTNMRELFANRTIGSIAMKDLAQRHTVRIYRRGLPEGVDSVGKVLPIAYGIISKAPLIHAIGGKAVGAEGSAGNDTYIACSHQMCFRVWNDNSDTNVAAGQTKVEGVVQFREAKIWHSLDQFTSPQDIEQNPAALNANQFGEQSQNPFPRLYKQPHTLITEDGAVVVLTGPHYMTDNDVEPYVRWFNAGEDKYYRYKTASPSNQDKKNRQITLVDNQGNPTYSGIQLRGDDYWAQVSAIALDPANLPTPNTQNNYLSPQYPIRNGMGRSTLYMDFNGIPDFDDGFITGLPASGVSIAMNMPEVKNPAGLVQHPIDIMAHFILKFTKVNGDRGKIDWPSFRKARGMLNGWRFSLFLNEVMRGEDVIGEIQKQCRTFVYYKDGRYFAQYINLDPNREVKYVFDDGNIDIDSMTINTTGVGEMYSRFNVKYDYYRPLGLWNGTIECNPINNASCKIAEQLYGTTETLDFECSYISDKSTAIFLMNYLIELHTKQRIQATLKTQINSETSMVSAGDLVILQVSELPNRALMEKRLGARNTVPRLPFVVTKISIDKNRYNLELLQLHPRSSFR